MKRYQQTTCGSFKMEPSTFARLRKEILDKLQRHVENGTFSNSVIDRVKKSSVAAVLHFSDAEDYMDRFNSIVDKSGPSNLPIPHTYGFSKSELMQPWYPEGDPKHDIQQGSEKMKVQKTEKEVVTDELHEFLFGQVHKPKP